VAHRTEADIVKGVDQAAYARENNLTGYTVRETYQLFRRGGNSPESQVMVETTYVRDGDKSYKTLSESGSASGKLVLHRILKDEKELSQSKSREDSLITSRNYQMSTPDTGEHELRGRKCLIVLIKPRRSSPYLLDGKIWVDASTYHIVRLEGVPSAEPSIISGRPFVERDYSDIDGFPLAVSAKSTSKQKFLGETVLLIQYENYKLLR
jgi:hypothetical protein